MTALTATLLAESPRYTPRPIPWPSRIVSIVTPAIFVLLLVQGFLRQDLAAWSIGIVYILYDTALLVFTAVQIRDLRQVPVPVPSPGPGPALGVIVAAYNEAGVLEATIDRLRSQRQPPETILIADDGSDDDIAGLMQRRYGIAAPPQGMASMAVPAHPTLRWLRLAHRGKAHALNDALLAIDCAVVLTVDADTLLKPDAIAAMRAAFAAEPQLVAATGVLAPICGPSFSARLFEWFQSYEYVRNFLSRHAWEQLGGLLLISGAFAAFRRDAVIAVGGFDADCLVEDYELIHRLQRHARDRGLDWRVRVVGGALAYTDAPATPLAFLRQRRRWFGGFLQTQHWNRDMVANRRYGRLGTRMLPVKALDTVQPIYGLTAFAILAGFVVAGRYAIALPVLLVMLAKITVDLSFHLWSLHIYKRWTGQEKGLAIGPAIVAAIAEPFTFQLLRHAGAMWGWFAFLTGRATWHPQTRTALGGEP